MEPSVLKALTHLTGVISPFHREILKEKNEVIMAVMAMVMEMDFHQASALGPV